MALGSQSTTVQAVSDAPGLSHDVFASGVKWHVRAESATATLFNKASSPADYKISGDSLKGAAMLRFANGAMATAGKVPNHQFQDAAEWSITPIRRYRRIAEDNFATARLSGAGVYQDYNSLVFDELWDSWGRMEIRHAVGDTRGYVCLCSSRTSQTVIVVKDGYGHTGTNPLMHIDYGTVLAWLDASNSYAVAGAGAVSAITYSTKTVTFSTNFDDGSTTIAAGDPLVMATSPSTSAAHFQTEYNNAPHGAASIVDPGAVSTTKFGLSQTTWPRWASFVEASGTFDQSEVSEHFSKIRAYSNQPVNTTTHMCVTQSAPIHELARTLLPYQEMGQLGRKLEGGHDGVRITGIGTGAMDFLVDDYQFHDVLYTLCTEDLKRADLGGAADFYEEDGSMWSRLPDEDKQEAFVREYMATWADRRNRNGALTGITLNNVSADDFAPVPR